MAKNMVLCYYLLKMTKFHLSLVGSFYQKKCSENFNQSIAYTLQEDVEDSEKKR